jgi:hypothetical protein
MEASRGGRWSSRSTPGRTTHAASFSCPRADPRVVDGPDRLVDVHHAQAPPARHRLASSRRREPSRCHVELSIRPIEHQTKNVPAGSGGDVLAGRRPTLLVGRGGVEPPTFHFSGGRSYQLSYLPHSGSNDACDLHERTWKRPGPQKAYMRSPGRLVSAPGCLGRRARAGRSPSVARRRSCERQSPRPTSHASVYSGIHERSRLCEVRPRRHC